MNASFRRCLCTISCECYNIICSPSFKQRDRGNSRVYIQLSSDNLPFPNFTHKPYVPPPHLIRMNSAVPRFQKPRGQKVTTGLGNNRRIMSQERTRGGGSEEQMVLYPRILLGGKLFEIDMIPAPRYLNSSILLGFLTFEKSGAFGIWCTAVHRASLLYSYSVCRMGR